MPPLPPLTLDGGVAVITGAASGIGAALARCLARRGMRLALVDIDAAGLGEVAAGLRSAGRRQVSVHVHDLADPGVADALPEAVRQIHGQVQVLVNNAGVALGGRFTDLSAADFDWLMQVNFHAPVRLTRAFLPLLAQAPAAQLVNVSSIFGIIAPPGQSAYCASKFALRGFSESLRHELEMAGSTIGVTVIHPGGVRTAIAERARLAAGLDAAEVAQERARWRRLLTLDADTAAERIALGLQRRERRVLVGRDAVAAAWLQRLFPVGYWHWAARDIERRSRA